MAAADADRRRARRGRAYFVLAAAAVLGVITSFFWSAHLADELAAQQQRTVRELCGVIQPFASTPVARPSSSRQHATAAQYAWHQRFVVLSGQFRCGR